MSRDRILKLLGLNLGIAVVDIILFSPGLIGIEMGGESVFATALGTTVLFMSVALFFYGNYKLLMAKERIVSPNEIEAPDDYVDALKIHRDKKTFSSTVDLMLEQIDRLKNKRETITEVLQHKFTDTEMSYRKFQAVITEVEKIFYLNIKNNLNKLNAFDEEDYLFITKNKGAKAFSEELKREKLSIYQEYITFVNKAVEQNEQILLKLDKLLLEISKLNILDNSEIEKMPEIQDINNLIQQARYYK